MSGSILGTHDDSPIDLGKRQVFLFNENEYPQWPEPKMFGRRRKYVLVQTTYSKYSSYAQNHQCMRKTQFIQNHAFYKFKLTYIYI